MLTIASGGSAIATTIDLAPLLSDKTIAAEIEVLAVEPKQERCHIHAILTAPRLWSDLDVRIAKEGNLGSSRNRLYWVGPTRLRAVEGNTLYLTSRARYESWTIVRLFGKDVKNKNFQDTKTVDFLLTPQREAPDRVSLTYEIQNIRNVPGELEEQLKRFGVEFGGTTIFTIPPDDESTKTLDPRIEAPLAFAATADGNGLALRTTISLTLPSIALFLGMKVDSCTVLKGLLKTVPNRAANLAIAAFGRL